MFCVQLTEYSLALDDGVRVFNHHLVDLLVPELWVENVCAEFQLGDRCPEIAKH